MFNSDNYRGLNRFPEVSNEKLPQWFFDSKKASHRPSYWKPIPTEDRIFRNKTIVGNENGHINQIQKRRISDDPFYQKDYQMKYENDFRLPEVLYSKNVQRPLGTWRTYAPTREQLTGEKDPDWINQAIGPGNRVVINYQQLWLNNPQRPNYTSSLKNKNNRTIANNFKTVRSKSNGLISSNCIIENKLNNADFVNTINHIKKNNHFKQLQQPTISDTTRKFTILDVVRGMNTKPNSRPIALYNPNEDSFYETSSNGYKILRPKFNNVNGTKSIYYHSDYYNGNPDKTKYSVSKPKSISYLDKIKNNRNVRVVFENDSIIPNTEYKSRISGRQLAVQSRVYNMNKR